MDHRVTKPLFAPTYRMVGYCCLIGVAGALAALLFDQLVEWAQLLLLEGIGGYRPPGAGELTPEHVVPGWPQRWWLPVVTTLGGLLSGWLVFRFAPEAEGHGTDAAVAAYHQRGADVRSRTPVVKAIASALTLGSGGVAGREGPTAQIAVGVGAMLARILKLRGEERRILLLAGMSAGLAAMFQAPLGMAIFAVEILYAGMVFESEALIYTIISAVTAYAVHGLFAGWEPIFAVPPGLGFAPEDLLGFAILGLLAGALGALLPALFYHGRDLFRRVPLPRSLRPALGGLLVGLLALAAPELLGTGYGWVELALSGQLPLTLLLLLLLAKGPAMVLTIGSGGAGGVFAPTITLGAMLGAVVAGGLGPWLPGEPSAPALIVVGMAAVFAGAARTPISTLILVAEMTGGYGLIVPAMLANVLAFLIQRTLTTGRRYPTLYESQVEDREDSPAHRGVFVRRALEVLEGGRVDAGELTLPRLVNLLRYGEPVPVSAEGIGMLVSLDVQPHSALDGSTVAESIGSVEGATVVAVLHGDTMLIPRGPTRLHAHDQLILLVTPDASRRLTADAKSLSTAPCSTST